VTGSRSGSRDCQSFGRANIWSDVTLTLPPGEVSVPPGPSGTGKSVFLKTLTA
jgi:phospholipid/cholesterol/gamma-HCH transport system ATP-binding protein